MSYITSQERVQHIALTISATPETDDAQPVQHGTLSIPSGTAPAIQASPVNLHAPDTRRYFTAMAPDPVLQVLLAYLDARAVRQLAGSEDLSPGLSHIPQFAEVTSALAAEQQAELAYMEALAQRARDPQNLEALRNPVIARAFAQVLRRHYGCLTPPIRVGTCSGAALGLAAAAITFTREAAGALEHDTGVWAGMAATCWLSAASALHVLIKQSRAMAAARPDHIATAVTEAIAQLEEEVANSQAHTVTTIHILQNGPNRPAAYDAIDPEDESTPLPWSEARTMAALSAPGSFHASSSSTDYLAIHSD